MLDCYSRCPIVNDQIMLFIFKPLLPIKRLTLMKIILMITTMRKVSYAFLRLSDTDMFKHFELQQMNCENVGCVERFHTFYNSSLFMPRIKRGYNAKGLLHYGFDTPLENIASHSICRKTTEVKTKVPTNTLPPSVVTVFEEMGKKITNDNVETQK